MIVEAFLRWAETARATERARAANALGRAYLKSDMSPDERKAAGVAMTWLLDDPSPQVRGALAEAVAEAEDVPKVVVLSLAEDQIEIAAPVILRSPLLSDIDLVDLVGRGADHTRALVAARRPLGCGAVAALAEIAAADEIALLLENDSARFTRLSLRRIAERHGDDAGVRCLLLDREDLPADVRHILMQKVASALCGCGLVRGAVGVERVQRIAGEAETSAAIALAGAARAEDCVMLVDQMRRSGRLTPAFLMQALCSGRTDFFGAAVAALSGLEDRRVRAILATGRFHSIRALVESAGLGRAISILFVEAVLLWRDAEQNAPHIAVVAMLEQLLERAAALGSLSEEAIELLEIVEKLHRQELRRRARDYAVGVALAAA
ncbi:DUF2336 domain-containing protein [Ciceribacter sp. L1K22]|uniref:DUF2336 domain-containing protein n=1 Tax=Ciceribacter sp. L1K22 TaxID=2820275 RepID=UPI001ABDBBA5|nr:DUF2336 domain-containing protein [Ciceribacter sp. L1K22]